MLRKCLEDELKLSQIGRMSPSVTEVKERGKTKIPLSKMILETENLMMEKRRELGRQSSEKTNEN